MITDTIETGAAPARPAAVPAFLRSKGEVRASFVRAGTATAISRLYETGGLRLKFPSAGAVCEGVIVNTAGGMTGGDEARFACELGRGARAVLATQSAEKIYRAEEAPVRISVQLHLEPKASLAWVPQETILFDSSGLARSLEADMEEDATLTVLEIAVFGRTARGERVTRGSFHDRWRIRRGGRLLFAEDIRLQGDIASTLDVVAVGSGASAIATLLHVAPKAEARVKSVRAALARARSECGASAWDGMLVARFAARDALNVRTDAAAALRRLLKADLPRIWTF